MLATLLKKGGNMSVLRPISEIRLYKCPALSPTYRDSYYFKGADADARKSAQEAFFNTLNAKTLNESQVTRISNNQVKVPFPVAEVKEYNYMAIVNQKYDETTGDAPSDRIYYCFIMNAEYVSNMCTLITFEVDVIQTYICDAGVREAFVERCHSNTDVRYEHRETEKFSVSNYTVDAQLTDEIGFYVVIGLAEGTVYSTDDGATTHTAESHTYTLGGWTGTNTSQSIYSGVEYLCFDISPYATNPRSTMYLKKLINYLNTQGHIDAITDLYMIPKYGYSDVTLSDKIKDVATSLAMNFDVSSIAPKAGTGVTPTQLSGYTPKNKKLYNYPYCYLKVINNKGESLDLKWEEFGAIDTKVLECMGNWYGSGQMFLMPKNYEGVLNNEVNKLYSLSIRNYPVCTYTKDSYKEWKAQKMGSEVLGATMSGVGSVVAGVGALAINPIAGGLALMGAGGSIIRNFGGIIADDLEASKKPNLVQNNNIDAESAITHNMFGFTAMRYSLSRAEAEEIDNYFTMFGYAYNKIMNVRDYLENSVRPSFRYIKTAGFNVQGNFPANYKLKFDEVFNNGITFWETTATVGEYDNNDLP